MQFFTLEVKGHIAWLTFDRPPANAMSYQTYSELAEAFDVIDADDMVFVTIIKANGRFFSAGNDVKELNDLPVLGPQDRPYAENVEYGLTAIIRSAKPVICLVQGLAGGSGFCIPSYSDIVLATPEASFGIPEISRGIIGGAPEASFSLPPKVVRYLALTGSFLSAEDAEKYGFVLKVVPKEDLIAEGEKIANEILKNPPLSVRFMKESLANIYPPSQIADLIAGDEGRNEAALKTEDFIESVHAFVEKRPPQYKGR
ncbi:enoyl-CoA hydratase [Clostridia bacterium]|nr:enoyl-CoA hydratase [Clostridia bacterium]